MMPSVGSVTPVTPTGASTRWPPVATSGSSLLAAPCDMPTDPLLVLYYCEAKDQQLGLYEGEKRLQGLQSEHQNALKQELDAIEKHVEAAHNKSFWDDLGSICSEVAKVAAVVVSVAAAVASWGAATPIAALAIAGAVMSTAGFAESELHVLQKLGASDNLARIVDASLSVGGAVCSLGGAELAGGCTTIGRVATAVEGVAAIGSGAATIGAGNARAEADRAAADEVRSEGNQSALRRVVMRLLEGMKTSDEQSGQKLTTLGKTVAIRNQTASIAAMAT